MRGKHQSIINWLDPTHQLSSQIYLDANLYNEFARWIEQQSQYNPIVAQKLHNQDWQIYVFREQLNRSFGINRKRDNSLKKMGVNIINAQSPYKITYDDELYISEMLRVYFNNDSNAQKFAQFLLLARRHSGNDWITVITQHRGFWRIPMVNSYYLNSNNLLGSDELPAYFDFIHDFGIHPSIFRAIGRQLNNPQHGQVIFDAIIALQDHIRLISGLNNDGYRLMNQAFDPQNPLIQMNPLTDPDPQGTQQNEQKGFHRLYCGVPSALRNPLAHEGPSSQFAQERYPDKKTMLKFLSFLSLLCERADRPLP